MSFISSRLKKNPNPALIHAALSMAPRGLIEWEKKRRLQELVRYCAARSPFYGQKFKELDIDPNAVKDLNGLSRLFTTGEDLIERREDFLCARDELVFETTGTQGRNKWLHFTWGEVNRMANALTTGLMLHGLGSGDRFLNCFNYSFWVPGFVFQKGVERLNAFCLGASKTSPEGIYERLEEYDVNVLLGYPSLLQRVTEIAEKKGAPPMKAVLTAGERLTEEVRQWFEEVWRAPVYSNYGLTEACGGVGGECRERNGYHIEEMQCLVEIAEPDSNGYGEILLTTPGRRCMPLIRYRTGDVGRLSLEPCPCGLPTYRLESVPGRLDEKIKIGTAYFLPNVFDASVRSLSEIGPDYQLVAWWEDKLEVLELNVEAERPAPGLEQKIHNAVCANDRDMATNVSLNMFELRIKINSPGSLRGDAVKLKRFVDKRPVQEGRKDFSAH